MYPYDYQTDNGLNSSGVLGGLMGLASQVGDVYQKFQKPNGLATPTQAQQATKTATQTRPWLPWAIGGVVVIVLGVLGFVLLRPSKG